MTNKPLVAAALFVNAASSLVGFAGYSAGPRLGEPYTSIGYLAFAVWSAALLPAALYFFLAAGGTNNRLGSFTLLICLCVIVSGIVLQTMLFLRLVTLEQTVAWNFASAGGVGLWLALTHFQGRAVLPRGLRWFGIVIGVIWMEAFVLLASTGFPAGGPKGSWLAAIGFGSDGTAYFASIVWAIWLGLAILRPSRQQLPTGRTA